MKLPVINKINIEICFINNNHGFFPIFINYLIDTYNEN